MKRPDVSKHSRTYVGVATVRDGERVAVPFKQPVTVSATKTPGWILKDRRRAANRAARKARRAAKR